MSLVRCPNSIVSWKFGVNPSFQTRQFRIILISNRDAESELESKGLNQSLLDLASGSCVDCRGAEPITEDNAKQVLRNIPGWNLKDGSIEKEFRFKSYRQGLDFACAVGQIAEQQNHHPDMLIAWRRVRLTFSTHTIKGLSGNDFVMAAKSELEYEKLASSNGVI